MAFRKKSSADSQEITRCDDCFDRKNQLRRHLHFLKFADEGALGGHLRGQYGEAAEFDGTIGVILAWVRSIQANYSDFVDNDGARLPAWKAWVMTYHAAAREDQTLQAPRTEQGRLFAAKV